MRKGEGERRGGEGVRKGEGGREGMKRQCECHWGGGSEGRERERRDSCISPRSLATCQYSFVAAESENRNFRYMYIYIYT